MATSSRVLAALRGRGLLADATGKRGALAKALTGEGGRPAARFACYAGFDPTASSLHVGNLVALAALRVLQMHGHRPVALLGGATGLIGDPSGRSTERVLLDERDVRANQRRIERSLRGGVLAFGGDAGAKVVDNMDWYAHMGAVAFVRDVGRHFRLQAMLNRESVRGRLSQDDDGGGGGGDGGGGGGGGGGGAGGGMSFTEFSYQLFQAYDFLHLARTEGVRLQVGGSDQWGNITAGCELARRVGSSDGGGDGDGDGGGAAAPGGGELFGLTVPLLTNAAGEKLGKSTLSDGGGGGGGGAVWLDPARTTHYAFYQYFLNVADADVGRLLRHFSGLAVPDDHDAGDGSNAGRGDGDGEEALAAELDALLEDHAAAPHARRAQRRLAAEATRWVRGAGGLAAAQRATAALFPPKKGGGAGGEAATDGHGDARLLADELLAVARSGDVPAARLSSAAWAALGGDAVATCVAAGACASRGAARRLVAGGGVYVNDRRVAQGGGGSAADAADAVGTAPGGGIGDGDLLPAAGGARVAVLRTGRRARHVLVVGGDEADDL